MTLARLVALGLPCALLPWTVDANPKITVSPDSLAFSIVSGEFGVDSLSITNPGLADLIWDIQGAGAPSSGNPGPRILWDLSHDQNGTTSWSSMVGELESRGASVTQSAATITTSLLSGYDVIWTINSWTTWTDGERQTLATWIAAGGGLVFEGNANAAVSGFNTVLESIGADIRYSTENGIAGWTYNVLPHPITAGIDTLNAGSDAGATLLVGPDAQELVRDLADVPLIACAEVGLGRVVAMTVKALHNDNLYVTDNLQYGLQLFQWLHGVPWLSADPAHGTVPPSLDSFVRVTVDPSGFSAGSYDAALRIGSNDPSRDVVIVPVHVEFQEAPDITIDVEELAFGPVSLDSVAARSAVVRNAGHRPLEVWPIDIVDSAQSAAFSVSADALYLIPGATGTLVVTFDPPAPGNCTATLRLHANDPDEARVDIPLSGAAMGSTAADERGGLMTASGLGAPSPNPFSGYVRIPVDLPASARGRLAVYDATGRLVRVLGQGTLSDSPSGWDGRDDRDTVAASGVYFIRLDSAGVSQTRKIVRLKR